LATHLHIDGDEHLDDCQICVIVKSFSDVDFSPLGIDFSSYLFPFFLESYSSFISHGFNLKGFDSQAPPF